MFHIAHLALQVAKLILQHRRDTRASRALRAMRYVDIRIVKGGR